MAALWRKGNIITNIDYRKSTSQSLAEENKEAWLSFWGSIYGEKK